MELDGVPVAEPFITQGICGQITDLQAGKLPQELIEGHPGLGKLEADKLRIQCGERVEQRWKSVVFIPELPVFHLAVQILSL